MSRALYGSLVPSYICKSAEEMPSVANDKDLLLRLDTGEVHYYDADAFEWYKVGGSSDDNR